MKSSPDWEEHPVEYYLQIRVWRMNKRWYSAVRRDYGAWERVSNGRHKGATIFLVVERGKELIADWMYRNRWCDLAYKKSITGDF